MNTFLDLALKRFSARKFSDKPIEQDKIDYILAAAKASPTARNMQPQKIYLIKSEQGIEKAEAVSPCIYGSKYVFMLCTDGTDAHNAFNDHPYGETDIAIVCTHMMLAAKDVGVDSCWVGHLNTEKAKELFELPENETVWCFLPVGYIADDCEPADRHTIRKDISEYYKEI